MGVGMKRCRVNKVFDIDDPLYDSPTPKSGWSGEKNSQVDQNKGEQNEQLGRPTRGFVFANVAHMWRFMEPGT